MSKNRAINRPRALSRLTLLVILAALSFDATADVYSFTDNVGNRIRLFDEPCDATTGWLKLKKAEFKFQGKDYKACWAILKSIVLVLDEDGSITPVPIGYFAKESTI